MNKIIVRIKGGLGNQLFCYAAARRLALANNAELVIDDVTGFARDSLYNRQYMLDRFNIKERKATAGERMEPFERFRRALMKFSSRNKSFSKRQYIEQEGLDFDERLLNVKVKGTLYLDGLWQSENYFKDVKETIKEDFQIVPPKDEINQRMAESILCCNAVAIHLRFFDKPINESTLNNLENEYYSRAVKEIKKRLENPRFFVFSDNLEAAKKSIKSLSNDITWVDCNKQKNGVYADFWLMTQCKHFIIANSTFSWWAAWLMEFRNPESLIIACDRFPSNDTIPNRWMLI